MLISELPDECLLEIFSHISCLHDLTNCFKVCIKWSHLVAERIRKVKYLIGYPDFSTDYVYYQSKKPIDEAILSLFTNLMIVDLVELRKEVSLRNCIALIRNQKCFKGLMHFRDFFEEPITNYCCKLEMISSNYIGVIDKQYGSSVKQFHLWSYSLDAFKEDAHHFPNLERLYIYNDEGFRDFYYDGPRMEKLKIVEFLNSSSYISRAASISHFFQFIDSCPNLQSAHIEVDSVSLFIDESVEHKSLQDLVLCFTHSKQVNWNDIKKLFTKYPNLKHLALRDNLSLKDEHIEYLVQTLPNLVLFDVRGCRGVTQRAADYVRSHCEQYGQSIKFYFNENKHEIETDWPKLSSRREIISQGFDFMKHCFLKSFFRLSFFLIPTDN